MLIDRHKQESSLVLQYDRELDTSPAQKKSRGTEIKPIKPLTLMSIDSEDLKDRLHVQTLCSPICREVDDGSKLLSPRDEIVEELKSIKFQETVRNKAMNDVDNDSPMSNPFNDLFVKETEQSFDRPKFIQFISNRSSAQNSERVNRIFP